MKMSEQQPKQGKNDQKTSKMTKNQRKTAKNDEISTKMTENQSKTAKNDRKSMKMTENGPKTGEKSSSRLSRAPIDLKNFFGPRKKFEIFFEKNFSKFLKIF